MENQTPIYKRVHVIVNPAAGQDEPILNPLNRVFHPSGIDWDVFITKQAGDARRLAKAAVAAGVDAVAAYGGDGTIMEAASGLAGSEVPLVILPGGTANVMSVELGIPNGVELAAALLTNSTSVTRWVDMGQVGDDLFLLRVGIGLEAQMVEGAGRELKDRIGSLAYAFAALQALREPQVSRYRLTLDGKVVETEGITCIIANAGNLGRPGLFLVPSIDVSDGLLDVVVIRSGDMASLLSVAASVVRGNMDAEPLLHWQAREITVESDPPQMIQVDGEILPPGPISIKTLARAVKILVPGPPVP